MCAKGYIWQAWGEVLFKDGCQVITVQPKNQHMRYIWRFFFLISIILSPYPHTTDHFIYNYVVALNRHRFLSSHKLALVEALEGVTVWPTCPLCSFFLLYCVCKDRRADGDSSRVFLCVALLFCMWLHHSLSLSHGKWEESKGCASGLWSVRCIREAVEDTGAHRYGSDGHADSTQKVTECFRWDLCVTWCLSVSVVCPSGHLVCCLFAVVWHTGEEWGAWDLLGMREAFASPGVMGRLGVDVSASPLYQFSLSIAIHCGESHHTSLQYLVS